ncbi:aminobenzoate synthetase [Flavobacterium akiainvivens]|uniref:Aminobenzoate synthetase n=1 Tax=Flavobacterium akiainvivens TaxID=1202724 RepID=A0A0M8MFK0_9FLAO|nr:anthranilate synthase component I family protein [Flavobacterium akiainvivens]KOS05211.1 aminobenzoate synthetase [Flavobacterium akiainvivens]SFQ50606.1 para-aminobenzoate synthetase component 1 [Flavobacterium akiainvivens]
MRTIFSAGIQNPEDFKTKLLAWAQQFREVVYMDSNNYAQAHSSFDAVLAVDALTAIQTDYVNAFEELNTYQKTTKDWLFGYLSYDLKNDTEVLASQNLDGLGFPDLFFFQPKKIFLLKGDTLEAHYLFMCDDEWEQDLEKILGYPSNLQPTTLNSQPLTIQQRISKESYIDKVEHMRSHIYRGDIYEANFCMEFYAEDAIINPLETYQKLNAISEPPFAVYLKNHKQYLLSASPERYLKKEGSTVITQPIKGTARRSANPQEDEAIKQELQLNEKERAENIMIVDLVRNDLSHTAEKNSVKVDELCGVYTFKQVHHLISTVSSSVGQEYSPVDVIKSTFPMGSMTGAPKISAMQIIEKLEETKRGLYSGAVGYFTPEGDFDFNVVIRSILYNEANNYVSFSVGSAITYESAPKKEYDECLLKANAMRTVLMGE